MMKKLNLWIIYALILTCCAEAYAQEAGQRCASDERMQQVLEEYPHLREQRQKIEEFVENYVKNYANNQGSGRTTLGPVTIPVVVHVVYRTQAENISNTQIQGQIAILNADFNRQNADTTNTPAYFSSVAGNPQITFCLATRDPVGFFTNGITRTQTDSVTWFPDDSVKSITAGGARAWPTTDYLNIWVCNMSGPLGYAYYPGTAPAGFDGVVVDYRVFGLTSSPQYGLGRTATHEVGHYFDVLHVWGPSGGCGNDLCGDTPRSWGDSGSGPNTGCPGYPKTPGCTGETATSEMFMNFMDYVDDSCMNLFSADQAVRMRATLDNNGSRESLLNSIGCQPACAWGLYSIPVASNITYNSVTISWSTPTPTGGGITNTGFNVRYRPVGTSTWTTVFVTAPATSTVLTGLSPTTTYEFDVQVACSSGGTSHWAGYTSPFTTAAVVCSTDPYEQNNSMATAYSISTAGTTIWPLVCPANDMDYFKISNSYALPDIMLNTGTLPADYAMDLLDSTGTVVATSVNPGVAPESITYLYAPVATYYVKMYSQTGAFSPTTFYSLTFNLNNSCAGDGLNAHDTSTATPINSGDSIMGTICPKLEVDYFKFNADTGNPDIEIWLGDMSTDYDVDLLDSTGSVVISAVTSGLYDEQISLTSVDSEAYYIVVYSSQGLYHSSNTYTLNMTQYDYGGNKSGPGFDNWIGSLEVYPNPASEQLNIDFHGFSEELIKVELIDIIGRTTRTQTAKVDVGNNHIVMDIDDLAPGSYVLKLKSGTHMRSTNVIIR